MDSICGLYQPADKPISPKSATASEVAEKMCHTAGRNGNPSIACTDHGAIASATHNCEMKPAISRGIHAALIGTPKWTEPEFADIAKRKGHSMALIAAYKNRANFTAECISGSFSYSLIDYDRQTVLLCVDRMGVHTLCYALLDGGIIFGSDISTLLRSQLVSNTGSPDSIFRYLYFHVIPSPSTLFTAIRKLEPAQSLKWTDGSIQSTFYWNANESSSARFGLNEAKRQMESVLRGAVRQIELTDNTGCFLSGGLDSSTICGLANEESDFQMKAYSIGFDQPGYDEMSYATSAAAHFRLDHRPYYVTPEDVANAFDVLSLSFDEPFGNSSAIPAYFCAMKAQGDGIKKLIAGDGGDELFGGNERYKTQLLFAYYDYVPSTVRKRLIEPLAQRLPLDSSIILRKIRRYIEQSSIPLPDRLETYNYLDMFGASTVFSEQFLSKIDQDIAAKELRQWFSRTEGAPLLDRMMQLDWKITLADNDLRKVNKMCDAAGVSAYYPFLDDNLVKFSVAVPQRFKIRNGELRYLFKETFRTYLPNEILNKEKHGFGLPFGEWLKSSSRLRNKIMPIVDAFRYRGIVRKEFLDSLLKKHEHDHAAFYGEMIWLFAVLENWLTNNDVNLD